MSLTPQEVQAVAHLARLELTDAELATMTRQLSAILDYVAQLQQVNTDGVEPLAHALPVHNVFRDDEPAPSLPVDEALANAPDRRTAARASSSTASPPCWNERRAMIEQHRLRAARRSSSGGEVTAEALTGQFLASHPRARAAGPGLPPRR